MQEAYDALLIAVADRHRAPRTIRRDGWVVCSCPGDASSGGRPYVELTYILESSGSRP